MKVIVGSLTHKYGMNHYASRTEDGLMSQVADFCREYWSEFDALADHEPPEDDREVINEYFDENAAGQWESLMYDDANLNSDFAENLKMDLDGESLTIYIDNGKPGELLEDREYIPVVYWHIDEVEEDATVALSMVNAVHLFYTDPEELFKRLGL